VVVALHSLSMTAEFLISIHCVSKKNFPPLTCCNLHIHDPNTIIFGSSVTKKVRNQIMLCLPTSPASASALACERGNLEDGALVHCSCNTVQLLERSWCPFSCLMSNYC